MGEVEDVGKGRGVMNRRCLRYGCILRSLLLRMKGAWNGLGVFCEWAFCRYALWDFGRRGICMSMEVLGDYPQKLHEEM